MGDHEVKLYGSWASPCTRRVELALKLKGVKFEFVEEDLYNKSDLLIKYNPIHKQVPVLVHNGLAICESLVILEYIDETWNHHLHHNHHLMPKEPYHKAMARFWAKFVDEKIIPTEKRLQCAIQEEKEKIKEEFHYHVNILEEQLKDKEYFYEEKIGYLDIVVVFMGHFFQVQSQVTKVELISEHKHPILSKWIQKLHKHDDVVHGCFPPTDKHLAFFKAHFDKHAYNQY